MLHFALCWLLGLSRPSVFTVACHENTFLSSCCVNIGGACYSWGWNEHGMCGDGTEANVWAPKPVQVLQSAPGLLVGCGAGHSLAVCQLPAQPDPGKDLNVAHPPSNATEDINSEEALDKEKLEGKTNFNPNLT
ncbi:Secretion-regulating guanine nucleotide exchange factor [Fukomys damarensis]|uniref:Secretion-regulating guanine nucleotide exchange factor n=1 Tax=Fukomys damarensis TaxID=885580 RepID=A0A091CLI2_FUKDA|nr:Secretion-regulating guanine nucleotide exchange factor [Fukomys damarensis]